MVTYPPRGGVPVRVVVPLLRTLVAVAVAIGVLTGKPGSVPSQVLVCSEQDCRKREEEERGGGGRGRGRGGGNEINCTEKTQGVITISECICISIYMHVADPLCRACIHNTYIYIYM